MRILSSHAAGDARHRIEPRLVMVPEVRAASPSDRGNEAESETLKAAPSAADRAASRVGARSSRVS